MEKELRKKAEKKVQQKKEFYIVAFIFASISVILLILSFAIGGPAAFWIRFPMLIFALVLGILYLSIFGVPGTGILSSEWEETELEKEMYRLYRKQRDALPPAEELSEEDRLELKELERLKRKWEGEDDYV
jgi:hypothetical protein